MPATTAPAIRRGEATGDDPSATISASETPLPSTVRHRRRILLFGGIGAGAYLLALLATVPARLVLPSGVIAPGAVSGTVWHGEAALPGGDRLAWRFAPLRTLAGLAYAADLTVTGAQTDLAGRIRLRPGSVRFDSIAGRAGGGLLRAAFPDLPFTCETGFRVDLPRVAIGTGAPDIAGEVRSTPGRCTPAAGGTASAVPALIATARADGSGGTALTITPLTERRRLLARTVFGPGGQVAITIRPAGAALFPFASPPGGLSLATTL